jgi:hypothetical protein
MKLIDGWQRGWRLTSVQAAASLVLLNVLEQEVLPRFNFVVPERWMLWINAGLGLAIIALRVVAQPGALDEPPTDQRAS